MKNEFLVSLMSLLYVLQKHCMASYSAYKVCYYILMNPLQMSRKTILIQKCAKTNPKSKEVKRKAYEF